MAATLKTSKQFRSWENEDLYEQSDVVRLFDPETVKTTKSVNCFKYWSVYCTLVGFVALFFIGILIGFLLRVDAKVDNDCSGSRLRRDGFDREKLQAVHNNIVYFMSGDNIARYASELSTLTSSTTQLSSFESAGKVSAEYVAEEFRKFGFDKVEIQEHDIVVTSPDPLHPNRLEILPPDGSRRKNFTINRTSGSNKVTESDDGHVPFVAFSPSGKVKGPLVYGHYGRHVDFLLLELRGVALRGTIVLLRIGRGSVAHKAELAARFGCDGVLLYCQHDDPCNHSNKSMDDVPMASARDLTDLDKDELPTIPLQTVSYNVAMNLLAGIPGSSLPTAWQTSIQQQVNSAGGSTHRIYLEVNNQRSSRKIYNVVATVYGHTESDRQILLGSSRYREPVEVDRGSNTGILLELGKSMAFMRDRELWKPRRTVKFVSFGGDAGMYYYLKSHRHLLSQEAVAYIDLDLGEGGMRTIQFKSSLSLVNLIWKATDMVPDPSNTDFSLAETWPRLSHDWYMSNESTVNMLKSEEYPLLHQLGIPSISLNSLQVRDEQVSKSLFKGDITHHFQDHLAAARVVSIISLKLADDAVLPVNISFLTRLFNHSLHYSLDVLKRQISGLDHNIGDVLAASSNLSQVGKFPRNHSSCSKTRQLNNILMRFESIFWDESSRKSVLSVDKQTGALTVLIDLLDRYFMSKNTDPVYLLLDKINMMLHEALQETKSFGIR